VPDAPTAVLVLAAGEGDQMNSRTLAHVLHAFGGRTMLDHVLAAVEPLSPTTTVVLLGERGEQVAEHLAAVAPRAIAATDREQAHRALPDSGPVLVVAGDAPMVTSAELAQVISLGAPARLADAAGKSVAVVVDAKELPRTVGALDVAGKVLSANTVAHRVHNRQHLANVRREFNQRLLEAHMRAGVTVVDPATTWVDAGVAIEADVTLWPSVDLHGTTTIGAGASIGPDVTLTDTAVGADARISRTVAVEARIGARATVGPFAYLRPGTDLADEVHIGTYVELKKATVGVGTKIPHLSYVGDATIGEHSNIGAATVFVNYDGVEKHHTVIGSHARTGADNMFVAPVEVGDGAYTAAGSVITQDVPSGAMGVARAPQRNVAGWVARKRPGTPAAEAAARVQERQED
jgi:bifunctional UDP-N-acetylglucosamine pyrophosphorylase/glucosamine-1-phosphate N-acetyltransferase